MNLVDTQQLLTMLWSLYPNAPKLARDDKIAMSMAWLAVLSDYALEDVWKAAKRCFQKEPRFVPSAPQILSECEKSLPIDQYLATEYNTLSEEVDASIEREIERHQAMRLLRAEETLSDADAKWLNELEEEERKVKKLNDLWKEAVKSAEYAYDGREKSRMIEDGSINRLKLSK